MVRGASQEGFPGPHTGLPPPRHVWAELQVLPLQDILMYLQALPTQGWKDGDVRMLLSEAYVLMTVWSSADAHFTGVSSGSGSGMGGR